ncbi:unnamed protein product, partial [Ectocarpus fasciculatus]
LDNPRDLSLPTFHLGAEGGRGFWAGVATESKRFGANTKQCYRGGHARSKARNEWQKKCKKKRRHRGAKRDRSPAMMSRSPRRKQNRGRSKRRQPQLTTGRAVLRGSMYVRIHTDRRA